MRRINKQIPAALVMLLLTTLISYLTGASENSEKESGLRGIKVLKELNTTLPEPRYSIVRWCVQRMTQTQATVGAGRLLGQCIPRSAHRPSSVARIAGLHGVHLRCEEVCRYELSVCSIYDVVPAGQNHYNVHTNQELVALGLCNFVGSFFNAFPSSASLARTAVNYQVGSRSPLCNALTAVLVGTLLCGSDAQGY